ncbi:MAG: hypothetical protein ACOCUR_01740 [Nanoarchaeota archaeon]
MKFAKRMIVEFRDGQRYKIRKTGHLMVLDNLKRKSQMALTETELKSMIKKGSARVIK